jgi:AGCS family alanine or glycine:cation symporter
MMVVIMYGSINQAKLAWNIGDLGVGLMAWFNIIAILLYKTIAGIEGLRKATESRKRSCFNPEDIGVSNAHIWNTIGKIRNSPFHY